mmetsp:Transcript_28221/g.89721  ORF Transcript_28221/g.89721 Transcript_28221/m.89721 type:complete len:321 (-) Transcript_28221:866-1828(-)
MQSHARAHRWPALTPGHLSLPKAVRQPALHWPPLAAPPRPAPPASSVQGGRCSEAARLLCVPASDVQEEWAGRAGRHARASPCPCLGGGLLLLLASLPLLALLPSSRAEASPASWPPSKSLSSWPPSGGSCHFGPEGLLGAWPPLVVFPSWAGATARLLPSVGPGANASGDTSRGPGSGALRGGSNGAGPRRGAGGCSRSGARAASCCFAATEARPALVRESHACGGRSLCDSTSFTSFTSLGEAAAMHWLNRAESWQHNPSDIMKRRSQCISQSNSNLGGHCAGFASKVHKLLFQSCCIWSSGRSFSRSPYGISSCSAM